MSAKLCIPNGLRAVAAGRVVFRIAEMVIHLAFQGALGDYLGQLAE